MFIVLVLFLLSVFHNTHAVASSNAVFPTSLYPCNRKLNTQHFSLNFNRSTGVVTLTCDSQGMEGGMKTGNMHRCLKNLRWWRHGHCGWRTGVWGSAGGGEGGGGVTDFLAWHTHHCPFPVCLLKNAQLHSPSAQLSQAKHLLRRSRVNVSSLQRSHISCQTFPGDFKGKLPLNLD